MSMHQAEWLAGEIIAGVLIGHALLWAWRGWRRHQAARYKAGPGETTEHSSTQDD